MDKTVSFEQFQDLQKQLSQCLWKDYFPCRRKLQSLQAKHKQGKDVEDALLRLMVRIEESAENLQYRQDNLPKIQYPETLPIIDKKQDIIETIQNNQVVVISGETGSGKTTQLPKMCLEAGQGIFGKIGCTQPRRIAATSVARQIRKELGGNEESVSYKIRFDSTDSDLSYIKLMTDGVLLAETQGDPFLNEYDTLIIDEAHERSLNIDFILGYLKRLLAKRKNLKVIISSATIDTETFSEFFDNAPIIEVSGRMYPVEVIHMPIDKEQEEKGEVTFIDMTVQAVDLILGDDGQGDILVFMPTEQDIRETADRLEKWKDSCVILPLFGRLSSADQNKVFREMKKRKIIVSTNIAETSLTIPGIRYVIDSGYARLSRYCTTTRTQRLPIERISQSSAEQRKGRCGRVEEGICIRLYSEEDFAEREVFTPPEIRRSNLAEVILRMMALKLGKIEKFSFINPPSRTAIQDGFAVLRELGAVDRDKKLTPLGWEMARIPIDPRTSRILLEATQENALREVLIIAAALSISDPRERPFEKEQEADGQHRQFMHPDSDFLMFVNLWECYQDTWREFKTQNQMRKFCRKNFLSYPRMREWYDIHNQLIDILKERGNFQPNSQPASYDAIHRSILSGFLSHIFSKKDKNMYLGRASKEYMVFPGSALFNRGCDWIVAGELVETSRLFARIVAKIEPEWIISLAPDLCNYHYSNPRWEPNHEQVVADEKITLFGLVVHPGRRVHYGKINRREAREIFISAIVAGELQTVFPFIEHNQELVASICEIENRLRRRGVLIDEEDLREFYRQRLPDVVNVYELKKFFRHNHDDSFLLMTKEDLLAQETDLDPWLFPDHIALGKIKLKLRYHFEPGSEEDGVTLVVPQELLHQLQAENFDWLIPGLLEEKIQALLRILPKKIRREITPVANYAKKIHQKIVRTGKSLHQEMAKFLEEHYGLTIKEQDWQWQRLEKHLQMRFEVIDNNGNILAASRDLLQLQKQFAPKSDQESNWKKALQKWNLRNLQNWCFDDLPESINITEEQGGIPYLGYPGLQLRDGKVNRTLFQNLAEAERETQAATEKLLEYSLNRECKILQRTLTLPGDLKSLFPKEYCHKSLSEDAYICLKRALLQMEPRLIRKQATFEKKRKTIQQRVLDIGEEFMDLMREICDLREQLLDLFASQGFDRLPDESYYGIENQLQEYFFPGFIVKTPYEILKNYPRYLQALLTRAERAILAPNKDQKKWQEIQPHLEQLRQLESNKDQLSLPGEEMLREHRGMLEEFKISIFAQEIGTLYSISSKRLTKHREELLKNFPQAQ